VSTAANRHFTRRQAIAGAVGTAALAYAVPGLAHDPVKKPNFLFIMADDLGYADLSCYGQRDYRTPVLDSLAEQGMKFTHGYANSAVCSATRVGLITGRYQYRVRVGLEEPIGAGNHGLDPAHPTLPSLLQRQGYHTALVGKWHLGALPDFGPLKSGYDEFWGNRGGGVDYFTHEVNGRADLWDGDVAIEAQGYYTDLLANRSIEYLETRAAEGKPWLLSLHLTAPHWPWEGNNDAGRAESARIDAITAPLAIAHYDGGSAQAYADMVTNMDQNIGRILVRLAELGMEQDTVVVFTSDNGGERYSLNWPFSGIKTELLEGGIRVPLIVKWPGLTAPGSETDAPALSMDVLPSFLAAAGGSPDLAFPTDGTDLRPALMGAGLPPRDLAWRFHNKEQRAFRRGQFKYLKIGPEEYLFDIIADPRERGNLAARMPEKFAELQAAWLAWNAGMLPDPGDVSSFGWTPDHMPDRYTGEE